MASIQEEQKGRLSVYFVTISLGIAFSITLLSITWNNALDKNKREFALQSFALKESVSRNVRTADNITNNFAAFFKANPNLDERQFRVFTETLLEQHDFVSGVVYSPVLIEGKAADKASAVRTPMYYQVMRTDNYFQENIDLSRSDYSAAVTTALASQEVLTVADDNGSEKLGKNYWMFKALELGSSETSDVSTNRALIAILIDSTQLLGNSMSNSTVTLTMISNASSLSARESLYQREGLENNSDWTVASLEEEGLTQFPSYSIRLLMKKELGWEEVDKELVFNALLIGVGVTLLIIALVRAKDQQSKELKERNIVIERQVSEQTRELAETRDKALEASRVKSEFLASMSHEIRTPLNAIIGMSGLLEETPLNSEQKNYINVFRKAGDTLLSLVNDILDLSKIEAKQLVLEKIEFDLIECVEESVEIYALKAAGNNVELLCHVDEGVKIKRLGDPARLRQIILNLISNALKFTEKGEVVLRVREEPESDGSSLEFSVTDSGIGIPKEKLNAIFASFTQVDSSTTRKYGGTGLGLTISRSLSEMMGGRIWVESEEGKGSTFFFTAKLEALPDTKTEMDVKKELSNSGVLIVDDNAACREIICSKLQAQGATITEAADFTVALELLTDRNASKTSTILLDFKMPGSDGFHFVEELKSKGINKKIILMLGAADLNNNISRIKESGIDAYLVKPVKRADLIKQVSAVEEKRNSGTPVTSSKDKAEVSYKPLRVLLVEDNPDNRLLINAYLKKLPYEVDEAENGQIAVDKFRQSDYDIVLMDVQMPIMDGHEATRTIRAWEIEGNKTQTPIISLTAHAFKEEIDRCLEAGCNAHLSKPVKKATLISTIQEYTESASA